VLDEAKEFFTEALNRDPTENKHIAAIWADTYIDRGQQLLIDNRKEEATRLFNEALKHDVTARERVDAAWADYYSKGR
jgi:tetratricopeptide (TPR) repeat protein